MHFNTQIQPNSWNRSAGTSLALVCLFLMILMSSAQVSAKEVAVSGTGGNTYERLKVFSEILSLIESSYVEPVESKALIEGAIRGMVKALDPHTSYLAPEAFQDMKVETSGKFGGLGIEISMRNGVLTVISPIEGTPAFNAGIQTGDKIIKIEGASTLDMTLADAVSHMRGEIGTSINITIFREGLEKPMDFQIVRDIIKVQNIKKKIYNSDIGYIKIRSFSKSTSADLDKALAALEVKGARKLILDVRNNPGGLLNQAVEVSDRFLDEENLIVYTKGRSEDQNMRFTTHDTGRRVTYPMIVLVNGGSASASEIVAGALQDLGRAVIVGTPTFGKGSVQTIIPLSDGSALRLTTARYYTPSGRVIQGNGVVPDIVVEKEKGNAADTMKDENLKKETAEKDRIRRFLREKDLKKHLKGKSSIGDGGEGENQESLSKDKERAALEENLEKDNQLRHAVSLLSGWDVMVDTLKPKSKNGGSAHLTLGQAH
jgi:carboxyl-terminal processing protease